MSISFGKKADETPTPNISIPLYVGAAIVQLSGLAAVAFQLAEPSFAYFTMVLSIVGLTCSFFLRRFGSPTRLIQIGAVGVALVFIGAMRGVGPFQNLVPFEAQGSQELLLVCALAFTSTFCSFLLVTDASVVFTCVWAIAIIGLTGTVNINQELIFCFIVFLFGAAFLLVHQNSLLGGMPTITESTLLGIEDAETPTYLTRATKTSVRATAQARWSLLRTQASVACACAIVAIILGFLIAIPMQMIGRNLSLATVLQRLNVPPAAAQKLAGAKSGTVQLIFDNPRDFQVGLGPVSDDATERATVQSPKPLYWRGRVYDFFNGHGWANSYADRNEPRPSVTPTGPLDSAGFNTFELDPLPFPREKVDRVKYRFHINSSSFTPLYAAAEARKVRISSGQVIRRPDNTLSALNSFGYEYEVESDVPDTKPSDLKKSKTFGYPNSFRRLYLQTPDDATSTTLAQLTETILTEANALTPYDKAEALRQWISSRCTYTLDAPAVPANRNAVDFFLNESKQGYCDLYATSLTMLCRYAGLPARVATGFAPGTEVPDSNPRTYVLRGSDLHSWTEVYFQGYGWIVFDATQDTPGTIDAARTPEPKADDRSLWERITSAGIFPVVLTILGFGGFMYFLVMEVWMGIRGWRFGTGRMARGGSGIAREIVRTYQSASKRFVRLGIRRQPQTSSTEYLTQVREGLGDSVADAFGTLTKLMQRAIYSGASHPLTEEDVQAAHNALRDVNTALKEKPGAAR